ncbi:uncharacterized protein [Rutidosis leptorrhynchoides]|uniref:uncharacterized protein n=1 Tax=Rutidosis leptorrhynchoides TaxID=125765 RepID=UPI003A9A0393
MAEYAELQAKIDSFPGPNRNIDGWIWVLNNHGKFSTKVLSKLVDNLSLRVGEFGKETIRNNLVPIKLGVFVWRAKLRRLPVRIELDNRGIDIDSVRCPTCDDDIESMEHAFIFCTHASDVWDRVFKWWGLQNPNNLSIEEILCGNHFGY